MRRAMLMAALLAAGPAQAHIVFAEPNVTAGSYYAGFLRVSHGCGASPTVSLRVEIPPAIVVARPQPKPGWTVKIDKAPLATPIAGEGEPIREGVVAVTWTGRLESDQFDQFGLMFKLPRDGGPLYFPTTQKCAEGENAWVTIPPAGQPWGSVPKPAPVLNVAASEPTSAQHSH